MTPNSSRPYKETRYMERFSDTWYRLSNYIHTNRPFSLVGLCLGALLYWFALVYFY